jgi:hypothetical protein
LEIDSMQASHGISWIYGVCGEYPYSRYHK